MKILATILVAAIALLPTTQDEGRAPEEVRFTSVELLVDSGLSPLAAWQVELEDPSGRARVVGIEGGEHPAFAQPAHYDPRALQGGRVILATFSLEDELPTRITRVATIHLEVRGDAPVLMTCELQAAADPRGREIEATVHVGPEDDGREDR